MASPKVVATVVLSGVASVSSLEPAAAPYGSVDGAAYTANVLHPARSPRNARLAAKLVFMSALGGISNAAILAAINAGAQTPINGQKASLWAATLFVLALVSVHQDASLRHHHDHRRDRSDHPSDARAPDGSRAALRTAGGRKIGRARIVAAITSDTAVLTQASNMLCFSIQAPVLIFFVGDLRRVSVVRGIRARDIVTFGADHVPLPQPPPDRGAHKAAEQERRLFDRLADFLDGFKEVQAQQPRAARICSTTPSTSRAPPPISRSTPRPKPSSRSCRRRATCTSCSAPSCSWRRQFSESLGGRLHHQGHDRAAVSWSARCFGLVQSIPILMNANAAADRIGAIGRRAAGGGFDRGSSRDHDPEALRQDRDARHRVPLHRQIFRRPRSRSARSTSPCSPASWSSSPAATARENRRSCGCSSGLYPPDSGEITLDGMRINDHTRDTYRGADVGEFSSTIICSSGSTAFPSRIRPRSTAC